MRTLVTIPDDDMRALDDLAQRRKQPRAKIIRQAVKEHLARSTKPDLKKYAGLWRDTPVDGLEYERRLRDEWSDRS